MRANALANLVARIWIAAMSFLFVPVYIRVLGIEAYGLIGFFATMMAGFAILDLGLALTVNRELARRADGAEGIADARDLMRTLEAVYWGVALLVGGGIALAAPWIVRRWLNLDAIPADTAIGAVRVMGLTALFRWPVPLYVGALLGLGRQVAMSAITAGGATLAAGGAALVLWAIAPTLDAFFLWQAGAAGLMVAALRVLVWRTLAAPGHAPAIRWARLRATIGFSAGVSGITLLALLVGQLDRIVLARVLPLAAFGTYALAATIAATIAIAGSTVEAAVFPVMTRLAAEDRRAEAVRLYHRATQGLALIVLPAAIAVILFARELLAVYLRDPALVERAAPLLRVLMAGHAVMALMFLPQSLQLAHGRTRIGLWRYGLSLPVYAPALVLLAGRYGAMAGAVAWAVLTLCWLVIEVPAMHRRLLPGEAARWYGQDVALPAAIAALVLGGARLLVPAGATSLAGIAAIGIAWGLAVLACALAMPGPRAILKGWWASRAR